MRSLAKRLGAARYEADVQYRAALASYKDRDLSAAKAQIEAAIDLLPTHAEYRAALGYLLLEDKDAAAAEAAFARALELHPYEMLGNYGQGLIAYRDKDWKTAANCFTNALAAQPERAETQYYLAMVCHRLGRNVEAAQWMGAAAAAFAAAEDRRERHCHAWLREFKRLI